MINTVQSGTFFRKDSEILISFTDPDTQQKSVFKERVLKYSPYHDWVYTTNNEFPRNGFSPSFVGLGAITQVYINGRGRFPNTKETKK